MGPSNYIRSLFFICKIHPVLSSCTNFWCMHQHFEFVSLFRIVLSIGKRNNYYKVWSQFRSKFREPIKLKQNRFNNHSLVHTHVCTWIYIVACLFKCMSTSLSINIHCNQDTSFLLQRPIFTDAPAFFYLDAFYFACLLPFFSVLPSYKYGLALQTDCCEDVIKTNKSCKELWVLAWFLVQHGTENSKM